MLRRPELGPELEQIGPDSLQYVTDEEWLALIRSHMDELRPLMHLDWR